MSDKDVLSEFRYAIQLFFDDESEARIISLIGDLRRAGLVNEDLIGKSYRPHISLGVYKELDHQYAQQAVSQIADAFPPIDLCFSFLGIFPGDISALFLGPTYSDSLRNIHLSLYRRSQNRPEECWELYHPGRWVPHCGLLIDVQSDPIHQGARLLLDRELPSATVNVIAVVGFGMDDRYPLSG